MSVHDPAADAEIWRAQKIAAENAAHDLAILATIPDDEMERNRAELAEFLADRGAKGLYDPKEYDDE